MKTDESKTKNRTAQEKRRKETMNDLYVIETSKHTYNTLVSARCDRIFSLSLRAHRHLVSLFLSFSLSDSIETSTHSLNSKPCFEISYSL